MRVEDVEKDTRVFWVEKSKHTGDCPQLKSDVVVTSSGVCGVFYLANKSQPANNLDLDIDLDCCFVSFEPAFNELKRQMREMAARQEEDARALMSNAKRIRDWLNEENLVEQVKQGKRWGDMITSISP